MSSRSERGVTDPGRKRRRNEDSFVCEPPLFAVADGMGGAQAGEVASRLARGSPPRAEPRGEERVVALIQEANRRVYERSSEDEAVSGMGTTMTVALVEDDTCRDRPRRRLARVPDPRRQARAADRGPLARRRARPQRQALAGGGRGRTRSARSSPRARHRSRRRRRHLLGPGPARRRLPALLGRPDLDGRRPDDPRDRRAEPGRPRARRPRRSSPPPTAAAARTTSPSSCSRSPRGSRTPPRCRRRGTRRSTGRVRAARPHRAGTVPPRPLEPKPGLSAHQGRRLRRAASRLDRRPGRRVVALAARLLALSRAPLRRRRPRTAASPSTRASRGTSSAVCASTAPATRARCSPRSSSGRAPDALRPRPDAYDASLKRSAVRSRDAVPMSYLRGNRELASLFSSRSSPGLGFASVYIARQDVVSTVVALVRGSSSSASTSPRTSSPGSPSPRPTRTCSRSRAS